MVTEGSLPFTQLGAIGLYPEPDESSPHPFILIIKLHFNIILPPILCLQSGLFAAAIQPKFLSNF
jgi:hypothetical protein